MATQPLHGAVPGTMAEALGALERALDVVERAVAQGVGASDDEALLDALRRVERVRNRLPVLDHPVLAEVDRRELPQRLCRGTTRRFLAGLLRLSPAEAARRARAAEVLAPRTTLLGEAQPPVRPVLAAAQSGGEVSPEQVEVVLQAVGSVDGRGFAAADVAAAEELLSGFAATFAPQDLRRLAARTVEAIDPDGTVPPDELVHDRRLLHLRQAQDGSWRGELRLTATAGAKLLTVLRPLATDRSRRTGAADDEPLPDERSHPQRMHDALEECCDLLLRADTLPASGGVPATVIATIDHEKLLAGTGVAELAGGGTISTRELLRLAGQADVLPAVLTASGAVLELGRSRRIASPGQTMALIARDGGCSFPGCDRAPQWCERHHVIAWVDGGATDLDNLTLLCGYHHRHFLERGWSCRVRGGVPEWVPPRWIDPARRPLVHHRVLSRRRQPPRPAPGASTAGPLIRLGQTPPRTAATGFQLQGSPATTLEEPALAGVGRSRSP
ncbi:HNH endonuclease signature motif containing protein [Desertihabitans aurantiacus]|uniref:HNH endonuclease signature motif containing protein n=1 Tax=Desertihabitans aurantiacus TaxID=2282477 RepID=UPI000DF822A7|nr:HNH endonuclease signature motif containing protein [Desertihabitans aurantiacus]